MAKMFTASLDRTLPRRTSSSWMSALHYEWLPCKAKMCSATELNFWCEFSWSVVSSDSDLDIYKVNLYLAENLRFCLLEIKAAKSNFSIFHNVPPEINGPRKILQKRKKRNFLFFDVATMNFKLATFLRKKSESLKLNL